MGEINYIEKVKRLGKEMQLDGLRKVEELYGPLDDEQKSILERELIRLLTNSSS